MNVTGGDCSMTSVPATPDGVRTGASGPPMHPGYNDSRSPTRGWPLQGELLSRIIRPESAARARERILQATALAIRHAARQSPSSADRHDILAFIVLALDEISESVDASAAAWEKRGYWLKADRFRRDWIWVEQVKRKIETALRDEDYAAAGDGVGVPNPGRAPGNAGRPDETQGRRMRQIGE
jgi:hypothetical protein